MNFNDELWICAIEQGYGDKTWEKMFGIAISLEVWCRLREIAKEQKE